MSRARFRSTRSYFPLFGIDLSSARAHFAYRTLYFSLARGFLVGLDVELRLG